MDLFIKKHWFGIIVAIVIIALVFYKNIDAILLWRAELAGDAYIAMASGVTALIALGFAIWQGWQNQKHNKLSLRPLLGSDLLNKRTDNMKYIKFELVNYGVGPLIVKEMLMFSDNEEDELGHSIKSYLDFMYKKLKGIRERQIGFLAPGSVMEIGNRLIVWGIHYDIQNENIDFIYNLDVKVKYQSVYEDEIYVYDTREDSKFKEQKLLATPAPAFPFTARKLAHIHAECSTIVRPWSVEDFAYSLINPKMFHTECESGFALGLQIDDTQIELLNLAVYSREQGKGLGYALLNEFIAESKKKGGQSIFLEVAKNNTPALHLYKKAGFTRVGLRLAYYPVPNASPIDAILMRLDIK